MIFHASITAMLSFFKMHAALAYLVCFLGAFVETLIPFSFFIYGELVFLPGAILAGAGVLDIWLVTATLTLGGALGDSTSYLLGRKSSERIFRKNSKVFNHRNYQKGKSVFEKYGAKGVFFSRLLGPLSWVTPFLAGTYGLPYRQFIRYNLPGVVLGIGEFIVVGYFFGSRYKEVLAFLQQYVAFIVFIVLFLLIVYYTNRKKMLGFWSRTVTLWREEKETLVRGMVKHASKYAALFLVLYLAFLVPVLFMGKPDASAAVEPVHLPVLPSLASVRHKIDFTAYRDPKDSVAVQPVNLIVVTQGDIASLFTHQGWIQDVIFSRQRMTPLSFWRLWKKHTPPVSDLYINGHPEEIAFQNQTNSSFTRLHVRFWKIGRLAGSGATVYAGSVSYDQGIDIVHYAHFFAPLHAVDPNIDSALNRIQGLFKGDPTLHSVAFKNWGTPIARRGNDDGYYTSGKVLVFNFTSRQNTKSL